eukprot:scaffold16048_cov85-Cylindrotheca_fusiformis.AAC.1
MNSPSGWFIEGSLPVLLPVQDRPTVGIIGGKVGQWAWIAKAMGLEVVWYWSKETSQLPDWLRSSLHSALFTTKSNLLGRVDVVLCDSKPPVWLHKGKLSPLVVSLRSARSPSPPPSIQRSHVHSDLGGLTAQRVTVYGYLEGATMEWTEPAPPVFLAMPVRSIASDTVAGRRRVKAPQVRTFPRPLQVRPMGNNLFHGGGLYPTFNRRGPRKERPKFLLPSVIHGWVHRRLTASEEWMVFDVPYDVTVLALRLPLLEQQALWPQLRPGRCLQQALGDVLDGFGLRDGGEGPEEEETEVANHSYSDEKDGSGAAVVSGLKRKVGDMEEDALPLGDVVEDALLKEIMEGRGPKENEKLGRARKIRRAGDVVTLATIFEEMELEENTSPLGLEIESKEIETKAPATSSMTAEVASGVDVKATKGGDDASVQVHLWDLRLCAGLDPPLKLDDKIRAAAATLRNWFLRTHVRKVVERSSIMEKTSEQVPVRYEWAPVGKACYVDWWEARFKAHRKDLSAGRDVVTRLARSSWWDWDDGSRPTHWKWPSWYHSTIRDGLQVWFKRAPDFWKRPQPKGRDARQHQLIKKKLGKVRNRRYVTEGRVDSLTSFFAVPKGEDDIRMVYDGTKSGLNAAIWVPRFSLPTVNSMLRAVDSQTFMADFDIGECFLNFVLHESMQALCGIDLTHFFGEKVTGQRKVLWERWARAAMGLKSSPYQAVQAVLVAKEVILGDRRDKENAYRWDVVRLNLPGSKGYDPSLPWVSKIRIDDGEIACDLFIYVDDGRVTAPSEDECWKATRQAASVLNDLGIQEAARKRRWGSRKPGAWAGSIVEAQDDGVYVTVDQEKWTKSRRYMGEILNELQTSGDHSLDFKQLEKKRGFLIYVTRTYPSMVPYLKGIHLTLDGWRRFRDEDGWKLPSKRIAQLKSQSVGGECELEEKAPQRVQGVKRLRDDIWALQELMTDASAEGSCVAFQQVVNKGQVVEKEGRIFCRYGHWCSSVAEQSSNYRELANLVETLEIHVRTGKMREAEVFVFTDNSTAEGVYYKGNSTSQKLFMLVVRLRRLEMIGELTLHVVHVAGTRMIASGADGGSRGDLNQGAMAGVPILTYVPLHLSAVERSDSVEEWIRSWWGDTLGELKTLKPEGWFDEAQRSEGPFLWIPPPAAADVAAEMLGEATSEKNSKSFFDGLRPRQFMVHVLKKDLDAACYTSF